MPINEETFQKLLDFLIANAVNNALTLSPGDSLGANVIHVNSNIPQELNLSITNILTQEVRIVGQPGPASAENYHFNIKFVNNQCFFSSAPPIVTNPKWCMKAIPESGAGYIMDLYLLSTVDINLKPASPAAGSTTTVQLQYTDAILANPDVEILQVGLTVGQNIFAILNSGRQPVTGTETVHLTTFTDAGVPTPLIATLVQPKTILVDQPGNPQSLLLRLVNTSPDPVIFAPPSGAGGKTPTAIQLTVDVDDAAAWALCNSGETDSLVVGLPANWNQEAIPDETGQKTWLLRPDYNKTTQIPHNSALEFPIHGVKTSLPPGFTNLYVTLREFPNYGTQTLVTQIEKSPLIYNSRLNSGLVSNGTAGNHSALAINGDTEVDLLMVVNQSDKGASAHFKGGTGVNIEGDARINDHTLWFREGSDKFHGIGFYGSSKPFANTNVNGPAVFGYMGGVLGSNAGEQKIALSWKETGNVGIGTSDPKSTLSINGGAAVGATYAASVAKSNSLIVEGNVGIGTNDPKSTLSVKGGAAVGATYAASVAKPNSLIVEGNVGIGTNDPKSTLSVKGGLAIGSYAETTTAVQNGMIVEGSVGIGNANPTMGKLQVNGSQVADTNTFAFFAYREGLSTPFTGLAPAGGISNGIWSDNRIVGVEFNAFSDVRIKDVIGRSDGAQDLATLMRVAVTDYTYKDTATRGQQPQKKVIGQQLLGVYTQAVSLSKDVVPDIYQTAKCLDSWIDLETTLQKGDRVRIIPDDGKESLVDVTEVASNRFRVSPSLSDGAVFVYGRLVNDFASVDYDAIAMLNVSATQQIKREKDAEVQALREENADLRARIERLENLIEEKLDHKKAQTAQMN